MDKTVISPYEEIELKIYAYTLPEVPTHEGYIKIGDTNRNVKKRIFEQVGTAGLNPEILFEKTARQSDGRWFHDKSLHRFLLLNGIIKKDFNGHADEWFYFNGTPEKAETLTDKYINRDFDEIQINEEHYDYVLRNEQKSAVQMTLDYLKSENGPREFLWNAKPRFGKTLTTYDFIRNIEATNVLIVTNRPAIANSWFDDFKKFISWQEPDMKFVSETDALANRALSREDFRNFINTTTSDKPSQITFISLQDLKGAKFAGGAFDKLEWVSQLSWDLLVIDEAHEGIDTAKTDKAFDKIKRNFTLHLSGTPFKALANNKFNQDQIFNWSYVDEQEAKNNWDYITSSNPYESLPTLSLFTYQMSKMIEERVSKGLTLDDDYNVDYAFDLNEFFKVKDNGEFEYESSVKQFLDNLSSGKFPFSTEQHRNELNHTFWLLPRVNAAKAFEKLLNNHPVFGEYKIVLAAGDGVSIDRAIEEEIDSYRGNEKSFDKVRNAIGENEKTITLSVGQLTTGVTIPEWSAVLMLNNVKSPSLYFQAAFRAQNPYEFSKGDKLYRKDNAYIFDFAPERTLLLFDEFANNLTNGGSKTGEERKRKIKKLLNFFPVIAEDEEGNMHQLDATEVLTIPTRITSTEVVKRGFMSNLLFSNIAGIFSGNSPFKEILDKIKPEKNRRLTDRRELEISDPMLNEEGNVEVPEDIVINQTDHIFGDKIYSFVESSDTPVINTIAKDIIGQLDTGFSKFQDQFNLNKTQTEKVKNELSSTIKSIVQENFATLQDQIKELEQEHKEEIQAAIESQDESLLERLNKDIEQKKAEVSQELTKNLNTEISSTIKTIVEKEIVKKEEKKKKTTEDDVRDHLRGFSRTIPAFLMAYGNDETTLANFEKNIDEKTFEELTSITIDEFKKLRDGFDYVDESGNNRKIHGLFNEVVFDASIQEFFNTKNRLSNYFDDSLTEDIFNYIPAQKTNQIFTPRAIVKQMVDKLEEENPDIFSDCNKKFVDLYAKSGLYITEIVKRLNEGLKEQIPDSNERIKWILENQVYACAPSNIIYNIAKKYIYADMSYISTKNIVQADTMKLAGKEILASTINEVFGDDNLKFDVVIGNPPYQEESTGDGKQTPPIYHLFMDEAYKLAGKVILITPARFLYNAGATPKSWNKKMLNDKHLKVEYYEQNSSNVFPNTDIKGGVAITYRDINEEFGEIGVFIHYQELNNIKNKVYKQSKNSFSSMIFGQNIYLYTDELHKDYPDAESELSKGHKFDVKSNAFDKLHFIFKDEKPNDGHEYVQIFGRSNNRRVYKWIRKDYIKDHEALSNFNVILPKANGTGALGEPLSTPIICRPMVGTTETFISIGAFDTEEEADAVLKYIRTKFTRILLGVLKITQDNLSEKWKYVPNQDFTIESDIDWSKTVSEIDQQLFKKYGLNASEIQFIEKYAKSME